jgi:hypothetical protein
MLQVLYLYLYIQRCNWGKRCIINKCKTCARLSINLLKPTGHVMHQQFNFQQLYALSTLYLCVFYLSENKQWLESLNTTSWLVFITEMKSVYSAVRTGSLNKSVCVFVFIWEQIAICATYSINWLVFINERKSVYSAVLTGSLNKAVCVFVFIWEQTVICATYSINWLVFITEIKSVYSAVRTGSLNKAVCASSLKG